jgi:hypothetical protein
MNLKQWFDADWASSGVDPDYARMIARTYSGIQALDRVLYSDKLKRTQSGGKILSRSILKRYDNLYDGGWFCPTLDWSNGWETESLWGSFKPINPSTGWDGKTRKYLHPEKEATEVFYLRVTPEIWQLVSLRYGVPISGDNFWQWVKANNIPIYITEGAKKAASLLCRGYVAIGLSGVWNFQENKVLKDCIKAIGLKDREVIIAFDYDPKKSTQQSVGNAAFSLFQSLKKEGAKPQYLRIPASANGGKQGIDDYFVSTGDNELAGCKLSDESLYPYSLWGLSHKPDVEVDSRYLGDMSTYIPESGLVIIKSPTGTGKTDSVAEIVIRYRNAGRRVIIISNRITTGRELARRFGLPYVDENSDLDVMGKAFCIESCKPFGKAGIRVTRVSSEGEPIESEWLDDCVVVLDEFDQSLQQMLNSSTCSKDRGWIISTFQGLIQDVLCRSDGLVIAMSADISDLDVEYLTGITNKLDIPIKPFIIANTYCTQHKYTMFSHSSRADLLKQFYKLLKEKPADKTIWFGMEGQQAKSKWGTQTLEEAIKRKFPNLRILRIDSETLTDPLHPAYGCIGRLNEICEDYDLILVSPSVSSAVSVNKQGLFYAVFDISAGLSSSREWRQRLDRVREGVDRHVFIPARAKTLANGATYWKSVREGKSRESQVIVAQLTKADVGFDSASFDPGKMIDPLCFKTWAKQIARFNKDAYRYRNACLELADSEGVKFADSDTLEKEEIQAINSDIKGVRDENWERERNDITNADDISQDEADMLGKQSSKTKDEQLAEKRFKIKQSLGGMEPTPDLIKKVDDGILPKWRLHYALQFPKFTHESDANKLTKLAEKPLVHAPDIRGNTGKIKLLQLLGVDSLMIPDAEFHADSPEIQKIATLARSDKKTIKDIAGITIGNSTIEICQSLLALMGCKLTPTSRKRIDGKRVRFYEFIPPDDERWEVFDLWVDRDTNRRDS